MSVYIRAFAHVAEQLRVPRVLVTSQLMGRTLGPVGDRAQQRRTVEAALRLLVEATGAQTRWDL